VSKEATVERKKFGERPCDMDAIALVNSFKAKGEGELCVTDIQRIAKALRAAAEKAWDEGYDEALMRPRGAVNPYRQPPKGDGNGE
jgi:hypothetical protein